MHHSFIDRYSDLSSPIHRWDARLKAVTLMTSIVCIVSLSPGNLTAMLIYCAALLLCWFVSELPMLFLAKRLAVILPFVLLMSLPLLWMESQTQREGIASTAIFTTLRASAAVAALSLLTSTTPFPCLIGALRSLRVPAIILCLMSFLYNFFYVLIDEMERLGIGRRSRDFGSSIALSWRSGAWMLGTFLIRSIERSERIYRAMAARGYEGEAMVPAPMDRPHGKEVWMTSLAIAAVILIRIGAYR